MDLSRLDDVFQPSAFAEPASVDHAAMYADAVVRLLASGGVEQVSMGAVARWMGQVPSAVKQRAGGRGGARRQHRAGGHRELRAQGASTPRRGRASAGAQESPTDIEVALVEWLGEALRAAVTAAVDPLDPAVARAVVALVADCLTEPD